MKKIPVGIIGVGGYTGLELLKILLSHPYFELAYLGNSAGGVRADELYPALRGLLDMQVLASDPKEVAKRCELVFLALPHKSAMEFAKELLRSSDPCTILLKHGIVVLSIVIEPVQS